MEAGKVAGLPYRVCCAVTLGDRTALIQYQTLKMNIIRFGNPGNTDDGLASTLNINPKGRPC